MPCDNWRLGLRLPRRAPQPHIDWVADQPGTWSVLGRCADLDAIYTRLIDVLTDIGLVVEGCQRFVAVPDDSGVGRRSVALDTKCDPSCMHQLISLDDSLFAAGRTEFERWWCCQAVDRDVGTAGPKRMHDHPCVSHRIAGEWAFEPGVNRHRPKGGFVT